jgi:hypothetical protein
VAQPNYPLPLYPFYYIFSFQIYIQETNNSIRTLCPPHRVIWSLDSSNKKQGYKLLNRNNYRCVISEVQNGRAVLFEAKGFVSYYGKLFHKFVRYSFYELGSYSVVPEVVTAILLKIRLSCGVTPC